MALAHKGLTFETVPWRFTEKDVIAFSSQELVPVLVDGGRALNDSWAICEYLESAYPEAPRLADSAQTWAHALFIRRWTDRSLHPAISRVILLDVLAHVHPKDREYFRSSREARNGTTIEALTADRPAHLTQLRKVLDPLRATLAVQPFLGGVPGLADYLVFGAFQWACCTSPVQLVGADDPIHAWRERMLALHGGLATHTLGYSTLTAESRT